MLVLASQSASAARQQELHDALEGVVYNAQALAAADLVIGTLISARDRFSRWSLDNARRWAADQLDEALRDVQRYRGDFAGMPAAPVAESSWDDLRHAIGRGYNVMWAIQDGPIGDDPEWQASLSWLGDAAVGTVQALPGVIRSAVHFATGEIITPTVGGIAAGLLPLWPLVVVGGILVVGGLVVLAYGRKKKLIA